MSELILMVLSPVLYFIFLLFILRYARLKPQLSKFIGVSLAFSSTGLFFLSIFTLIYTDDPDVIWLYILMANCFIIVIVGVTFIIGASQKQVGCAK